MKPKLKKSKASKINLKQVCEAAQAAGVRVDFKFEPKQMPLRLPDDPEPVKLLVAESERCSQLGNNWLAADAPNGVAADFALRNGWAYALAAAWLRCELKGELK